MRDLLFFIISLKQKCKKKFCFVLQIKYFYINHHAWYGRFFLGDISIFNLLNNNEIKMGNLKGYLFWPPFLKVFCQKWKFGRAKEMSASAGIWTRVPRSKGSYAIQWATPLLIENQQKLASYNNFCFGPFLTKNFQKGNGQNRYIFELLTLVAQYLWPNNQQGIW